jgi:phosphohistidine phosphatase SixA
LLLIRHASAGKRAEWEGDDRKRPLDECGRRQAETLVQALARYSFERILSSPYDRCVETVEPLATARGLAVELRDELGDGRADDGAALVRSVTGEPVALCVHGGLSEVLVGTHQKKGETVVLGDELRVIERISV